LDSALSAFSALYSLDTGKFAISGDLSKPRIGMVLILALGIIAALITVFIPNFGLSQLWWIFNGVGASLLIPTLLTLYWDKMSAKGARYGIALALIIGLPTFVYANFAGNTNLIVGSALFIVGINLLMCWIFRKKFMMPVQAPSQVVLNLQETDIEI
jgi:Na+/proline symporter